MARRQQSNPALPGTGGRPRPDLASSAAPSQRMLRVAEMVRHALAEALQRGAIQDDVLDAHVITVPEVRMSPDLKLATVYIMPLGGGDVATVLKALERNKKYIRGIVARAVNLKYAPDLRFRRDETFDEASRIDRLLDGVKGDLDKG
jgi:ribosome-binding factor A